MQNLLRALNTTSLINKIQRQDLLLKTKTPVHAALHQQTAELSNGLGSLVLLVESDDEREGEFALVQVFAEAFLLGIL
jgi:hypothetical protein